MKGQTADQTMKGALAAIILYFANKFGLDSELTLLIIPVVTGVLAWMSKKVGDPALASFLDDN